MRSGVAMRWIAFTDSLASFPMALIQLALRIGVAMVFWRSGLTKVVTNEAGSLPLFPLQLGESTVMLFELEYNVPLLPPAWAAWLAAVSELTFPILLVVGFASRISAAALLGMTLVIQLFVYPGNWTEHLFWAGALALILSRGAGPLSLDALLLRGR